MSKSVVFRYLLIVCCMMLLFVNFVACGAAFYAANLKDDIHPGISPESENVNSPRFGIHAVEGWKQLPIQFRVGKSFSHERLQGLENAMKTWEMVVGRTLFAFVGEHSGVDGDSFPNLYGSLQDGVNGEYTDFDWTKMLAENKKKETLATTIWLNPEGNNEAISTSDMRLNGQYYVFGDGLHLTSKDEREVVDMQTLALHELGHMLGLTHIASDIDSKSIMNPKVYIGSGLSNRMLSKGDIARVQKIYGCIGAACNIDTTIAKLAMVVNNNMQDPNTKDSVTKEKDTDPTDVKTEDVKP